MLIHPRTPFNFVQTLRFILAPPALRNGREFAPLLDYFVDGEYRRVLDLGGRLILYGVREEGRPDKPSLRVRILAGMDDGQARQAVTTEVARQFSTDLDLHPFYTLAEADPVLRHLVVYFRGMRVPQAPQVFEILISAIIEQQVNLSFAHKVKKAVIETYGRSVEFDGRKYCAFPEPAALAITTPARTAAAPGFRPQGPLHYYHFTPGARWHSGPRTSAATRASRGPRKTAGTEGRRPLDCAVRRHANPSTPGLSSRCGRGPAESDSVLLRTPQAANRLSACKKWRVRGKAGEAMRRSIYGSPIGKMLTGRAASGRKSARILDSRAQIRAYEERSAARNWSCEPDSERHIIMSIFGRRRRFGSAATKIAVTLPPGTPVLKQSGGRYVLQ